MNGWESLFQSARGLLSESSSWDLVDHDASVSFRYFVVCQLSLALLNTLDKHTAADAFTTPARQVLVQCLSERRSHDQMAVRAPATQAIFPVSRRDDVALRTMLQDAGSFLDAILLVREAEDAVEFIRRSMPSDSRAGRFWLESAPAAEFELGPWDGPKERLLMADQADDFLGLDASVQSLAPNEQQERLHWARNDFGVLIHRFLYFDQADSFRLRAFEALGESRIDTDPDEIHLYWGSEPYFGQHAMTERGDESPRFKGPLSSRDRWFALIDNP